MTADARGYAPHPLRLVARSFRLAEVFPHDCAGFRARRRDIPKAVRKITDDENELLVSYRHPAKHWIHAGPATLLRLGESASHLKAVAA
jgi:hypothetical protein